MKTVYNQITPYVTKDGSIIRELVHPHITPEAVKQSLAEAIIPPANSTYLHIHHETQEIYHITAGRGMMTLGGKTFKIQQGDTILIKPGTPHKVENIGEEDLKILCFCCPAYSHEDTFLMEG